VYAKIQIVTAFLNTIDTPEGANNGMENREKSGKV